MSFVRDREQNSWPLLLKMVLSDCPLPMGIIRGEVHRPEHCPAGHVGKTTRQDGFWEGCTAQELCGFLSF